MRGTPPLLIKRLIWARHSLSSQDNAPKGASGRFHGGGRTCVEFVSQCSHVGTIIPARQGHRVVSVSGVLRSVGVCVCVCVSGSGIEVKRIDPQ